MSKYIYISIIILVFYIGPSYLLNQDEIIITTKITEEYKKCDFEDINIIEIGTIEISPKRKLISKLNSSSAEQEAFLLEMSEFNNEINPKCEYSESKLGDYSEIYINEKSTIPAEKDKNCFLNKNLCCL